MLARGKTLAEKVGYRESLVESKKSDAKKWQDQIDEVDEEIARQARVIREGFENRNQMDLFVPSKDEAAKALTQVATVAGEPKPGEPHAYERTPGGECKVCGAGELDPVHSEEARSARAAELHPYTVTPESPEDCVICGYAEAAEIHRRHAFDGDSAMSCDGCELPKSNPIHVPAGDPAYDFDESDPKPAVVSSAKAIDTEEHAKVGGES
jgi:hypothetical protein